MTGLEALIEAAKEGALGIVDAMSDGGITEMRDRLVPDVNAKLSSHYRQASEEMFQALLNVVAALLRVHLGPDVTDAQARRVLFAAWNDPAAPARFASLFVEGVKSPSPTRRRMLAMALLSPASPDSLRDRVDAAVERLFPADVALLRQIVSLERQRRGLTLLSTDAPAVAFHAKPFEIFVLPGSPVREMMPSPEEEPETVSCAISEFRSLELVGCVAIDSYQGVAGDHAIRRLDVLPVGAALIECLEATRLDLDLEMSIAADSAVG
jgi:hypothetical protein